MSHLSAPTLARWFHADRAAGRHRDHRRPDRPAAARRAVGPRGRPPDPVHEQPEADRPGVHELRERQQRLLADDDPGPVPDGRSGGTLESRAADSSRPGAPSPGRLRSWSRAPSTTRSTSTGPTATRPTRRSPTRRWRSSTARATRAPHRRRLAGRHRSTRRPATAPATATGTSGRSTGAPPNSVGPMNRSLFGPNYCAEDRDGHRRH